MFFIFGTRAKQIRGENTSTMLNCNYCKSNGTVVTLAKFRYFHIFWIPIFAFGLKRITCCTHCKQLRNSSEIPQDELITINQIDFKTPRRYYFGSFLFMMLALSIITAITLENLQISRDIKNPEVGDIYEIKFEENGENTYTIYRIESVEDDVITFEVNDYQVNSTIHVDDLKIDHKNDYSELKEVTPSELDAMKNAGTIRGIDKVDI